MRTDIAGFVGLAQRGPLPEDFPECDRSKAAVKISSWKEFLTHFGSFQQYGYLAYAVRAFFENGGKDCYVVRVAATAVKDPTQNAAKAFFTLPSGPAVPIGMVSQLGGAFQCGFAPNGAHVPAAGDLLIVSGGGVTQLTHVASILANGQALLTEPLSPQIAAGATVSWFPAACVIRAASRGNWGNTLRIQITLLSSTTFSLQATVDLGPNTLPTEDEYYRTLTIGNPSSYNDAHTVLKQQSNLVRLDACGTASNSSGSASSVSASPPSIQLPSSLAGGVFYLQGGRDGLYSITLQDFSGGPSDLRGLRLLEEIEEIGIVAIPDAVFQVPVGLTAPTAPVDNCLPPQGPAPGSVAVDPTAQPAPLSPQESAQLQLLMIDQCQRLQYRVALIDPPDGLEIGQVATWPQINGLVTSPGSRFAAIYYPWLMAPDSLQVGQITRNVPPSGYVAGAYAQTDLTYGVQRPPANVELEWVVDVEQGISDLDQEGLNLNNINAIRSFPGRGIRVWGARSLATAQDHEWRFIHVRRLMSAIEETVERSSRWAVFQNNDDALRNSLTHSLTVLLLGIWTKGGLQGATPADAFYVKCDETNNPQTVIDQGQLICEIGIAIAAPMEFLVFEIRQDASGAQILEN